MKLSVRKQLYILIFANSLFIALLYFLFSELRFSKSTMSKIDNAHFNINDISKLEIFNQQNRSHLEFTKNSNDDWYCSYNNSNFHVNEHAINTLLFQIKNLTSANSTVPSGSFLWEITLTEQSGIPINVKVFKYCTKIFKNEKIEVFNTGSLIKTLTKFYECPFYETVFTENTIRANSINLQVLGTNFSFIRKNNLWYIDNPISRGDKSGFVKNILYELTKIHGNKILSSEEVSGEPIISLTYTFTDIWNKVDFFQKNGHFLLKKNDIFFDVSEESSFILNTICQKLMNLKIFENISLDSLEVKDFKDFNSISYQKLKEDNKWQISFHESQSLKFLEITGDKTKNFEEFLSALSMKSCIKNIPVSSDLVYFISCDSNIGQINFKVLRHDNNYFLLYEKSSSIFSLDKELIDNLLSSVIKLNK